MPSPSADPTAGWLTYASAKWGYTLKHPASWLDLGSLGAPDTEEYFANQQVGSPAGLDANGIFVAISIHQVTGQTCTQYGVAGRLTDRQDQITVDGIAAPMYLLTNPQPFIQFNVERGGYCYEISFVFTDLQARDSNESVAQALLAMTFKFGQPTAAAP